MKGNIYINSTNSCEQDSPYSYAQQKKNISKINQVAITQSSLKLNRKNLVPTEEYVSKADAVYKKVFKMMAMTNKSEGSSPEQKIVKNLVQNGQLYNQVNNQIHHDKIVYVVSNDSYESQSGNIKESGISPINNRSDKHYFTGFHDQFETSTRPVKQDISLSSSSCLSESHMLADSCMVYQPLSSKNSARNSFPEADVLLKMLDDQMGKKDFPSVIRSNNFNNNEILHANQSVNDFITTVLKQEYIQVSECDTSYRRNQIRIARSNELVESPRGPKPPLPSVFKSIRNPGTNDQTTIKIVEEYSQEQQVGSNIKSQIIDQQPQQQPKQKQLNFHNLPPISIQPRKKNLGYFSFVITMLQPIISNKETYHMPTSPRMLTSHSIPTSPNVPTSPHISNCLCLCENLKMMQSDNLKIMQGSFKFSRKSNKSVKKHQIDSNFKRKSQERLSRIEQTLFQWESFKQQDSQFKLKSSQLTVNSPFNHLKDSVEQQGINQPRNIEQVEKMQSFSSEESEDSQSIESKQSYKNSKIENQQKPMQQDSAAQSKFIQSQLIQPEETNSYLNEYQDKSYLIQDGIDMEANQSDTIIEQIRLVKDKYNIPQLNQKSPKPKSMSSLSEFPNHFDVNLVMQQLKEKEVKKQQKNNEETVTNQSIGNNYYRAESAKDSKNKIHQTSIYTKNIAMQRTDSTKSIDNPQSRQQSSKQIVSPNTHFSKMNTEQTNSNQRNKAISHLELFSPNKTNKPIFKEEQINSVNRNKAISHLEFVTPNQRNKPISKEEQTNATNRNKAIITKVESTNFIDKNKYIAKQKKNLIDPYIEFKRALTKNLIKDPETITQSQVSQKDTHLSSNQSHSENELGLYQKTIKQVQVKLLEMQMCFKK